MNRKKAIFVAAIAITVLITAALLILAVTIGQPKIKYVSSYYDGKTLYACSRPLKARLQTIPAVDGRRYTGYLPIDTAAAARYCHNTKTDG